MNPLIIFLIFVSSLGTMAAMEHSKKWVVFRNHQGQTLEIPSHIVEKSALLQSVAHHSLLQSIGTNGPKEVSLPELQDFELIQTCLEYAGLNSQELKATMESAHILDNMPHFIHIMDMCHKLNLPEVPGVIAQVVGQQLLVPQNRCMAFKNKIFNSIHIPNTVSALLAQEIIKPAKNYWLSQLSGLSSLEYLTAQEQITQYINPYQALLLLDSCEHKTKAIPFSFVPGEENALFRLLSPLARPSQKERLLFTWRQLKPGYKWCFGALGAAAVCGSGYAAYQWFGSK